MVVIMIEPVHTDERGTLSSTDGAKGDLLQATETTEWISCMIQTGYRQSAGRTVEFKIDDGT